MTDRTQPERGAAAPAEGSVMGERHITPVAGVASVPGALPLPRVIGMAALLSACGLVLWAPWKQPRTEGDERARQAVIRQANAFEPAKEPPPPPAVAAAVTPVALPPVAPSPRDEPPRRSPADELLEASRRAPVIAFSRTTRGSGPGAAPGRETGPGATGSPPYPLHGAAVPAPEPRNELADRLKPTTLDGVRAARLPDRHLVVTQGTAIPCVLETAMSSDVPGFASCVVQRDVMSDSGHVVLMEKGTQVVGEYRGGMRRGAKRMFVLWGRAKTPTGVIVNLASPATDALGRAGFDGDVDTHFWERFGAALLLSIVDDAGAFASRSLADTNIEVSATQGAAGNAAAIAVERSIDLPPTLTKNQGEHVSIFVARDLDFGSVYSLRLVGGPTASGRAGSPPRGPVVKP